MKSWLYILDNKNSGMEFIVEFKPEELSYIICFVVKRVLSTEDYNSFLFC